METKIVNKVEQNITIEKLFQHAVRRHKQGHTQQAIQDFRLVIAMAPEIAPHDVKTYHNLGNVYLDLNDMGTTTACYRKALDLVITANTFVAQLAGAMGKPTWLFLHYLPDWRWMLERTDSPWYLTMRLFRQPASGDWDGVFEALDRVLQTQVPIASTPTFDSVQ
jgi:hypothetical protein